MRINVDGTRDQTFTVGSGFTGPDTDVLGVSGKCFSVALQADGKILVGGEFNAYNGEPAVRFVRLNTNGSRDETFLTGTGFNNSVRAIAVQPDGKILCGGLFLSYNGSACTRIIRLNTDGTRDTGFFVSSGPNAQVSRLALLPDGRIMCGGTFTSYTGTPVGRIARLQINGVPDDTFQPGTGFNGAVNAFNIMDDGSVVAAGGFTEFNGVPAQRVARLLADGALDPSFQIEVGAGNEQVRAILRDANGRYLVLGSFQQVNGQPAPRVVRVEADGSTDPSFDPGVGFEGQVMDALLQPDGKLVAGGYFSTYENVQRAGMVRVDTSPSTSIPELPGIDLELFPNPTNGLFQLRTGCSGEMRITVVDMAGREVYHGTISATGAMDVLIHLPDQAPGLYLLQLRTDKTVSSTRFIIE